MLTSVVTSLASVILRMDPAGQACLDQRAARPLWWAIVQDLVTMTDQAMACHDSIATQVGEALWDSQFQPFIDDMKAGVADATKTMATFWVKVPDPEIGDPQTGAPAEVINFLWSSLSTFVGIAMILSIMFGCFAIMFLNRGSGFKDIGMLVFRYAMYSGLTVPVVAGAMVISHESAQWILDKSLIGTNFAENLANLFNNTLGLASGIVYFILLLIGAAVSGMMVIVMIFRGGIIIVRTGTILISVAVSNNEWGSEGLKTQVASLGAWIAYPMVAAIVYAAGFRLMGTNPDIGTNGMLQCLYGIGIMLMAIFALPAMMRVVHPGIGAAAGGKGVGPAIAGAMTTLVVMKSGRSAA